MDTSILLNPEKPTTEVSAGVKFATLFGVPALLAVYFAWFLTSSQARSLDNIEHMLADQRVQLAQIASIVHENSAVTMAVLRQTCVNSAKSTVERNACLSAR